MSRRSFVTQTAMAGAALATSPMLHAAGKSAKHPVGIQVYSVKKDMWDDPKGTLKKLADYGYEIIESYDAVAKGIFWGMGHKGFKSYLDSIGMKVVSSHCDIKKNLEETAAQAAEIGMKYLICPYLGPQVNLAEYRKHAARFNEAGEICKKHGIRFAYHNHEYSFISQDGFTGQEILIKETDPALVDFELDLYWIYSAGYDPQAFVAKHSSRIKAVHVKDRSKGYAPNGKHESVDLGTGTIPFKTMLPDLAAKGVEYFFVEQEYFWNGTPMKSAAANARYMKGLV